MIIHNKPVKFRTFDPDHKYEICGADLCCCVASKKLNFVVLSSLPFVGVHRVFSANCECCVDSHNKRFSFTLILLFI
jgi:hypothetical protein